MNKQRKVAVEYVKLCGLRNGEHGKVRQVGGALTLTEIADQLGTNIIGVTIIKTPLCREKKSDGINSPDKQISHQLPMRTI